MLIVEDHIFRNREKFIKYSLLFYAYPGFLLWNILTTWWIVNSTFIGALLANVLNALFMAIVFQAFHWTRKRVPGKAAGYFSLIAFWISFEYLHLNWDLNWPWLNLGNGFASWYKVVQWYEYTGALGGTLWVLVGNLFVFFGVNGLRFKVKGLRFKEWGMGLVLWVLAPVILSYFIYNQYHEEKNPVHFVVVQPNLDPYSEQYELPPPQVIGRIMELSRPMLDSTVNFLIAPESAIQENMWENDLEAFASIQLLRGALQPYPGLNMVVGGSTFYQLHPSEPRPRWARKFTDSDQHYVAFNAAILVNRTDSLQVYHKSKLTPGVEILPSFGPLSWLERYAIDLGGTVGSLGMDPVRKAYTTVNSVKVGPAICYESIFGDFFADFVRSGAEVMVIITNDGWWGKTAGHRQHYAFAHLRAIETRRSIARSANTGISAFIDQRGDATQETGYWVPATIKGSLNASKKITFYVQHGDYIARFMTFMTGLMLLSGIGLAIREKYQRKITVNQ